MGSEDLDLKKNKWHPRISIIILNSGFPKLSLLGFMYSKLTVEEVNGYISDTIKDSPSTFTIGLFFREPNPGPIFFKQNERGAFSGEILGEEIVYTDLYSTWSTVNAMFFIEDSRDLSRAAANLSHVVLYKRGNLVKLMYIKQD